METESEEGKEIGTDTAGEMYLILIGEPMRRSNPSLFYFYF